MIFSKPSEDNINQETIGEVSEESLVEELEAEQSAVSKVKVCEAPLRPSIISEGFEFVGELKAPHGNVTIDGVFKGTLQVKALIIGATGHLQGDVQAKSITLKGEINGAVDVDELQVAANARIDGKTTYQDLTIARGACVLGELKRR